MRHVHCLFDTFQQMFSYYNDAFTKQVNSAYKTDLARLELSQTSCENPVSYNEGKVVYICEPDLYKVIFSKNPSYQMGFLYTNASWGLKMYKKCLLLCHLPLTTLLYIQ